METKNILGPEHFCDECYKIEESDQLNYIWPFKRVHCHHNPKIMIGQAGEMGVGIFATEDLEEGEYLCCYFGKLTHIAEEYSDYTFKLVLPNNVYQIIVDSKHCGNISRYFNHSYEPNCTTLVKYHYEDWQKDDTKPYTVNDSWQYTDTKGDETYYYYRNGEESVWEKPAKDSVRWPIANKEEPHITFLTTRKIQKGEQLFIDYGKSYWEGRNKVPIKV